MTYSIHDLNMRIAEAAIENGNIARTLTSIQIDGLSTTSNMLVVQNLFLVSLAARRASGDSEYLGIGTHLLKHLHAGAWNEKRFPSEIHHACLLNGLVQFLETSAEELSKSQLEMARNLIRDIAAHLASACQHEVWGKKTPYHAAWNHAVVAFSALGAAGLSVTGLQAAAWRETALERVQLFFEHGITASGMTREGLMYAGFVFRNIGIFLRLCGERGRWNYASDRDNPYLSRLRNVPKWYSAELFPNGRYLQCWNDSVYDPRFPLTGFLMLFANFDPGATFSVWDRLVGDNGNRSYGRDASLRFSSIFESVFHMPSTVHVREEHQQATYFACEDHGYLVASSKDGHDKFSFNCGPYVTGHDQADNNSYTLFLSGVPAVIDSGPANCPSEQSASSSWGHNSVLVDGKGEMPCGQGFGVSGRIISLEKNSEFFTVVGDASRSYSARRIGGQAATVSPSSIDPRESYNPVRHAIRHARFASLQNPSLLIFDDIEKDGELRRYDMLLHTPKLANVVVAEKAGSIEGSITFEGAEIRIRICVIASSPVLIERRDFDHPDPIPFGNNHDVWIFSVFAQNPRFVTAIGRSCEETWRAPKVSAERTTVKVQLDDDIVVFPRRISESLRTAGWRDFGRFEIARWLGWAKARRI